MIAGRPVSLNKEPRLNGLSTGATVLVVVGGVVLLGTVLLLSAGYELAIP
jgi:hypothetical protein